MHVQLLTQHMHHKKYIEITNQTHTKKTQTKFLDLFCVITWITNTYKKKFQKKISKKKRNKKIVN